MADQAPNLANLQVTAILDHANPKIRELAAALRHEHNDNQELLRAAHQHLAKSVRPIYTLNEFQPASETLRQQKGSCSQRMACLESVARAAGVATRVRGLRVSGKFWYPRFRALSMFIPNSILLAWPQFHVSGAWVDFDELYGPLIDLAQKADNGFSNAGESVFDAVAHTPVDFLAKTCGPGCRSGFDLSRFVLADDGFFDTRDELFQRFGSLQATLHGRAFEILFGGRKSV